MSFRTGLTSAPLSFAQLNDVGLMVNGIDANGIMDMRTGTAKTLGMAAPGAAPTKTAEEAGNVTGTVKYRVRWKDASTQTYSLPSAELTVSVTSKNVTITAPGSPPSRATHWILERTLDANADFFPINEYDTATLDGTAIATTTYKDTFADATVRNRIIIFSDQGQPAPYRFCWVNGAILFMAGGKLHHATCSVNSSSTGVSSADGKFTSAMVGRDFSVDIDTDGATYKIASVTDANNLVLASNYAAVDRSSQPCTIAGIRNGAAWSMPGFPESWGAAVVGGLSNSVQVGTSLEAGIGLGTLGNLLCGTDQMWLWSYRDNPQSVYLGGDGRILPLQARRGALGPKSVARFGELIYGMDQYGVWRLSPGQEPIEIGGDIAASWKALDFSQRENFWINTDPITRQIHFWVCESGDTYPTKAYVWDVPKSQWVDTFDSDYAGATCGTTLPDSNLALRAFHFTAAVGSAKSYAWFDGIGPTLGAPPTSTLTGTLTAGATATSLPDTAATFVTAGEGLDGVPVTLVRAADGSTETKVIVSNTANGLTTNAFTGATPVTGDTYIVGPINTVWKTGRFDFGDNSRKKHIKGLWLKMKADTNAVDLNVRWYYDGRTTPENYGVTRAEEDGVSFTAGSPAATINPGATNTQSVNIVRYFVPCAGDGWCNDLQLEFYSKTSGTAWEILKIDIEVDGVDQSYGVAKD